MYGPVIEDYHSKTALRIKVAAVGGGGGVLFTEVQQQVLVHCSYFYDD